MSPYNGLETGCESVDRRQLTWQDMVSNAVDEFTKIGWNPIVVLSREAAISVPCCSLNSSWTLSIITELRDVAVLIIRRFETKTFKLVYPGMTALLMTH